MRREYGYNIDNRKADECNSLVCFDERSKRGGFIKTGQFGEEPDGASSNEKRAGGHKEG